MLASVVIYRRHLRHSTPTPSSLRTAPAPINLPPSYREDSDPVGSASGSLHTIALSPLDATLMDFPASVANKRLTAWLNPSDATLTKNRGEGSRLLLTRTLNRHSSNQPRSLIETLCIRRTGFPHNLHRATVTRW